MQSLDRIHAIEERATRLGRTLSRLCREAGVDYSTVWRWRTEQSRPIAENFERVTARLEARLDGMENEMRRRLGARRVTRKAS